MAIQITNIYKRDNGTFRVTIQDTGDQIDVDENNSPVYRNYFAIHNSLDSVEKLKIKFEKEIALQKKVVEEKTTIETAIKTVVEAIDVSKIETKG